MDHSVDCRTRFKSFNNISPPPLCHLLIPLNWRRRRIIKGHNVFIGAAAPAAPHVSRSSWWTVDVLPCDLAGTYYYYRYAPPKWTDNSCQSHVEEQLVESVRLLRPDHVKRRPNKLSRRTTTLLCWRCKNISLYWRWSCWWWMDDPNIFQNGGMPHLIVICHRQIRDGSLILWLWLPLIPISLYHVICEFSCSQSGNRVGVAQIKKFSIIVPWLMSCNVNCNPESNGN